MTDFDTSFAKLQKRVDSIKEDRQRKWEVIKTNSPAMADFLTEMNREFGKPKSVKVRIRGIGRVL